jgi:hypothetical protein
MGGTIGIRMAGEQAGRITHRAQRHRPGTGCRRAAAHRSHHRPADGAAAQIDLIERFLVE